MFLNYYSYLKSDVAFVDITLTFDYKLQTIN